MNTVHLSYPHHIIDSSITGPFSLAIGFFDGVHLGHREVIEQQKE